MDAGAAGARRGRPAADPRRPRVPRAGYPWSRDYGSGLDALVDLGIDGAFAARAFAAVARVFRHPANGLADLELVEVRVLGLAEDRADLVVRARWEGEDLPMRVPAGAGGGRWLDGDGAWLDHGAWVDD